MHSGRTKQFLTPREHQVLTLIVSGHKNKSAARALEISHRTVEVHRAKVMQKFSADNVVDLVNKHREWIESSGAKNSPGVGLALAATL